MRFLILGLFGIGSALTAFSAPNDQGQPDPLISPETVKDLTAIARTTCSVANQFYQENGFTVPVSVPTTCTVTRDICRPVSPTFVFLLKSVNFPDGPIVKIIPDSRRVFVFVNHDAVSAMYRAPLSSERQPAKWTKEYAQDMAGKFANVFIAPWKTHLANPVPVFDWRQKGVDPVTGQDTYQPGEWTVTWTRATSDGMPFEWESVVVTESETYGPLSVRIWFSADYDEKSKISPISRAQAIKDAAPLRDAAIADGYSRSIIGTELRATHLAIVDPEGLYMPKGLSRRKNQFQTKGRLTWVIAYQIASSDPYLRGDLTVYIDAATGRYLGCTLPDYLN